MVIQAPPQDPELSGGRKEVVRGGLPCALPPLTLYPVHYHHLHTVGLGAGAVGGGKELE